MVDPLFLSVPVLEAWDETPHLRGLRLRLPPELASRHVAPGQVVQLREPGGELGFFALANPPSAGEHAELLIKRGGRVADAVIAAASEGASLQVSAPQGPGFPVDDVRGRDVLLFATGSGISSIRALLHQLLADRNGHGKMRLYYGQRTAPQFAYTDDWDDWRRAGLQLVPVASEPGPGWKGAVGYVQDVAAAEGFGGAQPEKTLAYLSGVPGMLEGARVALSQFGVAPERIRDNR
jgi:NAD(P)H-flavin reductase